MLRIENINKMENTLWVFGVRDNGLDRLIECKKVERVEDGFDKPIGYYTFEFEIGLESVPLIIWFDRNYNEDNNGYRISNNLIHSEIFLSPNVVKDFKEFTYGIEAYLKDIESKLEVNGFNIQ